MMKWFIGSLALLCFGTGFAVWLGWGRRSTWAQASGWGQLSSDVRNRAKEAGDAWESDPLAPRLLWWGHATMEVVWAGQQVVVDPVANTRVKVAPRLFRDRVLDTSRSFDLILITHAHMDHLDNSTLEALPPSRVVLPAGSERFLSAEVWRRHQIEPLAMGSVLDLGDLRVSLVPAKHGGWRYPWQRGLFACGYVFESKGRSLYVAGDTASGPHFEQIRESFAPDYAVLPIGAYDPQWFLRIRHLNPEEAWEAAEQLGVKYLVPYHFGTYRLSLEAMDEPLQRFAAAASGHAVKWCLPLGDE
ncbi:MBL fold metallo-hydrolase [Coraliomargarita parva]|uniref:MBL fold metallo-hydrolase n=1 Tax=Coraliomargarita parva TaxID=3014050 RepID=UPI0022B47B83|nr:MBL fold metallo-hydrolase [Coraliomargarita parva]